MDACKLGVDMINEKQLKPFHSTYKLLTSKALVRRGLKEALELLVPLCSFCFFFPMLEGDGLAEGWEASQRVESSKCKSYDLSSSERYSDLTNDSSLLVQAIELSVPR
ncbi:hypothetical protein RHGRI_028676 [Rhododendron griersonianum]|uniref:Uncharacterized protein n=1 Tax=Rhododendron griersonianum TaxID=479676 RepID=A0AAV6IIN1_9ERIC|nr:hypothetical protein RHGRI_028676 [Rhododendron griersonianum]